ncbi:bone morphogenetic protein 15 [Solea senegalensis]|uniref:Bone morphogenetic protein 15 n=3 Tax=Solea senegalensis TaxID=28829 RepID=A0AAV6QXU6_SOLSE|nr:bone morphogenetic protein 15 [Solea senegalensis]KAG7497184.1 bone morphogenetic protein 15 [Solea senegalensis]
MKSLCFTNMRSARASLLLLCSFTFILLSSPSSSSSSTSSSPNTRRAHERSSRYGGAHAHSADQNVQFMLSLYRSAAEPDGRPKQHRKFGSNTVRLLRPTTSNLHHVPAAATSSDHLYTFTVHYNLDTLPSEQLIRASFVHLRSPSSSSSQAPGPPPSPSSPPGPGPGPRCRAQITSLGAESLVTLEPEEQWTETDITAHVSGHVLQSEDGHLTLTAQYWCTEPELHQQNSSSWWRGRDSVGGQRRGEPHVDVPSLLLYVEEKRAGQDWMEELLGAEGSNAMRRIRPWNPLVHRHPRGRRRRRRSKDSPELKDPSLDVLKNAPTSSSSFSTSSSASIVSSVPAYKRKTIAAAKSRCKLHSFRLSFDELGWGHYFIAPPVYNPRFCQGDCPRVLHYGYHAPNHAIIQTVISDLGLGDVPPPSCVPYRYMPMSVLVVHKKKVEYRELEDMVAESCTCR